MHTTSLRLRAGLLDTSRRLLVPKDGPPVRLTSMEFKLLSFLAAHPNETVEPGELLAQVWHYHPTADTRTVYSTIHRLRAKIEVDPPNPDHILTVRGQGIRFQPSPEAAPPAPTATEPRPPAADLLGRSTERAALDSFLQPGAVVTLWGPGGIGKTALALHAMARWNTRSTVPPTAVRLASASDERALDATVARSAGIALGATNDPTTALGHAFHERGDTLVVLDNVEHLAAAIVLRLARWRELAPRVAWLLTTRVPLGLSGERVVPVGSLESRVGVELFLRSSPPGTLLTDADRSAIARIVERVDGIPLAIQLAATRAMVMTPSQLLTALETQLRVLTRGPIDAEARHSSLGATIAWSFDTLAPKERRALGRLASVRGTFDLDAAESMLDPVGWAPDLVDTLTKHALVRRVLTPPDREPRFALWSAVAEFARSQPELAAELEEGRQLYNHHLVHRATQWSEATESKAGIGALASLRDEEANLRHILATGDPQHRVASALSLDRLWSLRGPHTDRVHALQSVLDSTDETSRERVRVRLAYALVAVGRLDEADDLLATVDLVSRDADCLTRAAMGRGVVAFKRGALVDASRWYEVASTRAAESGNHELAARVSGNHATALGRQNRFTDCERLTRRAIDGLDVAGNEHWAAIHLSNLANLYLNMGDLDEAERCYEQALHRQEHGGWEASRMNVLANRALLRHSRCQYEEAWRDVREVDAFLQLSGDVHELGWLRAVQADWHNQAGELGRAEATYIDAVRLLDRGARSGRRFNPMLNLAWVYLEQGREREARHQLEVVAEGNVVDDRIWALTGLAMLLHTDNDMLGALSAISANEDQRLAAPGTLVFVASALACTLARLGHSKEAHEAIDPVSPLANHGRNQRGAMFIEIVSACLDGAPARAATLRRIQEQRAPGRGSDVRWFARRFL